MEAPTRVVFLVKNDAKHRGTVKAIRTNSDEASYTFLVSAVERTYPPHTLKTISYKTPDGDLAVNDDESFEVMLLV